MEINKKTKIIATVGPAVEDETSIKSLLKFGVNVFRFNMKHNSVDWHEATIKKVQDVANEMEIPIGILVDLQGPEIRIKTKDKQDLKVRVGENICFCLEFTKVDDQIKVPHESFFEVLEKDNKFSIDDGFIRFKVVEKKKNKLIAKSMDKGFVGDNKGLNLVGKDINLPSLIDDDLEKLDLATRQKVDYLGLSFTRSKRDIQELRKEMVKRDIEAQVIAKLESQMALDNLGEIIETTDVVMIGRGDLGVEVPIEELTFHQKRIIDACRQAHKPVIVATQMLQSMMEKPMPTRAEATDVANAVFDGTDAVMLSGETASGKYPLKAVEAMSKIVMFNEKKAEVKNFELIPSNATELIVNAAERISQYSELLKIDHIIVLTETGYTAKILASMRPKLPIIAATNSQKTVELLTMDYGVYPVKVQFPKGRLFTPETIIKPLQEKNVVKKGQQVLIIHGNHWQKAGQTNAIVLVEV